MSTLALRSAYEAAPALATKSKPGFFQRLIAAQERVAAQRIRRFLASQTDRRLADLGYTAADIEALRQGKLIMPTV